MDPIFGVMTALITSFVIGLGIVAVRATTIHEGFLELRKIVNTTISKIIVPLLPLYIFAIFENMTAKKEVWDIIMKMLPIVVLAFVLTAIMLVLQFTAAGVAKGRNPLVMLGKMLPAYATALGTSSSAATIPVTTRCAEDAGVSKPVANFVIPLCATIHLAGSTVKITLFALDSFGTATNVTGDGAIAAIVDRLSGGKVSDDDDEEVATAGNAASPTTAEGSAAA